MELIKELFTDIYIHEYNWVMLIAAILFVIVFKIGFDKFRKNKVKLQNLYRKSAALTLLAGSMIIALILGIGLFVAIAITPIIQAFTLIAFVFPVLSMIVYPLPFFSIAGIIVVILLTLRFKKYLTTPEKAQK